MSIPALTHWRDGRAKSRIIDFVRRVTERSGPDFVEPAERIAVFDNDGTLWCERPLQAQGYFAQERLVAFAERNPEVVSRQPFKAYADGDIEAMKRFGKRGLLEVLTAVHAGDTEEAFAIIVDEWLAHATNPSLGRRFVDLTYHPQLELLEFLRANDFKTFIVSGGGIDVIRRLAEKAYGIPPEQVIGSNQKLRFELRGEQGVVVKEAVLNSFDDREEKVCNIALRIGRRPILVFGNSDGDLAMMRYALSGPGPRLALLLHHDDAEREFAYDRDFLLSPLGEALDNADAYGLVVVSMKADWVKVFSD